MKEFKEYTQSAIYPDAWAKMPRLKKIHLYFEWWCSQNYGRLFILAKHPKRSPGGYEWALWQLPWYAKYMSRIEFQLRYLAYPKPEIIVGFFPFYRRRE